MIYFDVTDVIHYARRSNRLTGIQRVVLNIVNLLAHKHGGDAVRCVFYDRGTGLFHEFDPSARPHDLEFDAESLLMDLGLVSPSRLFPSRVQVKSHLRGKPGGKVLRELRKADIYLSAMFAPQRLRDKGLAPSAATASRRNAVKLRRIVQLPPQSCLVLLGSSWFFPETWRFARAHRERGGEVVQFIHDVIPLSHPQLMPAKEPEEFRGWIRNAVDYASRILCNSRFTAAEFVRYAAEFECRAPVSVIPLAHEFIGYERNTDPPPEHLPALQGKRFVVTVGNIETRKNGMALIRSWRRLIAELGDATPLLVFAGRFGKIGGPQVRAAAADPVLAPFVRVFEAPSDRALAWLYRNCLFSAYPSLVEGWGLPVGESAWFGRVCVASRGSSIPEVCGDLMVYIDPENDDDIYKAIRAFVVDATELSAREAVIHQARLRRWSDVADDLYAAVTAA